MLRTLRQLRFPINGYSECFQTAEHLFAVVLHKQRNEEKQMAIFSVTDTGCGIPKEKQGLVFERFEKLNEYAQGTGLGLSICKLIVHKWRGSIWIDPDYTGGARFVFSHPLNIEKE